jgi:hypothetical protein
MLLPPKKPLSPVFVDEVVFLLLSVLPVPEVVLVVVFCLDLELVAVAAEVAVEFLVLPVETAVVVLVCEHPLPEQAAVVAGVVVTVVVVVVEELSRLTIQV